MSSLCSRIAFRAAYKKITYIPARFYKLMNDPLDHATGIEKREMCAKLEGNDNPFDMRVFKRGPGTKDDPNEIPSAFDARLVGCICNDEQVFPQWMWLLKGSPKRCECGHWFTLVEKDPV